nr:penicillin acylase family protein [Allomuricauda sp.]
MRYLSLLIWSIITIALCYFLNNPIGQLPAIGKIVSPSHGFWRLLEGEIPELPEEVINENLKDEVKVVWDENLIPHIYAQNDEDLYFVQGYVTASMRLWQMDFVTRAAEGRLSEIVGEATLAVDLNTRRKGMELGTQKIFAATMQDPFAKMTYEQYAKGVNAYLFSLDEKDWPLEYRLLDMEPEPWSALRTIRIANYMANRSNTRNHDIEYSNFIDTFEYSDWELLYGGYDSGEEPIVFEPGSWSFNPIVHENEPTDIIRAPSDLKESIKAPAQSGSNNWVVAPKKSATGNTLFAYDPHLGIDLPSLFFINHLSSPDANYLGSSIAGVPGTLYGVNDSIAYGGTNAFRDLVDWYKVKFTDDSKTKIWVDDKELDITQSIEEIKIKGKPSAFDTIYYSPFGVIANHSKLSAEKNEAWAYRWIGQDTSRVPIAILEMAKAKNWEAFSKAIEKYDSPHQNWGFAHAKGTIGMIVGGRYLVRQGNEGLFLRDGTKSANIWNDFIPYEHRIQQLNPDRGFVSSSNQYPVDSTYPYTIRAFTYETKRNRRINQTLSSDASITSDEMKQLQLDIFNMEAYENLEYLLASLNYESLNEQEQEIFDELKNWNLKAEPQLIAPAYFSLWNKAINELAWDELVNHQKLMVKPSNYRTYKLLREFPNLKWWDIESTPQKEDAEGLIRAAYKQMISEINQWREQNQDMDFNWSNVRGTHLIHLTQLKPLSQENIFTGGDWSIVNMIGKRIGPAVRFIVEFDSSKVKILAALPGGQSGNPGSPWYGNMTEPWANGEYIDLDLHYTLSDSRRLHVSKFKPVNE